MTPVDLLTEGLNHHRAGRFGEAERCYREVLRLAPRHSDALHLLGVLAHQLGHDAIASQLIAQAVAVNPVIAEYHNNLGQALERLGRREEAEACYRQAIRLKPECAEAHNNVANVLRERGARMEALESYRRAIAVRPDYADAHSNLGATLLELGQVDQALAACRRGIELNPNLGRAHNNLGNVLKAQGQMAAALAAYRTTQQLEPQLAEGFNNAGTILYEWRRFAEAIPEFERAIQLKPDYVEAHLNLANAYLGQREFARAAAVSAEAVRLKPNRADAHVILGAVLLEQNKIEEASRECHAALALNPKHADAHNNLAIALKLQGRIEEAIASFRAAVHYNPRYAVAHSGLLFTQLNHPDYDARTQLAEHRRWEAAHAAGLPVATTHPNSRDPNRRIRVGYVSADLCNHVVGRNVFPLFRHHDHARFEVFAFANVFEPDGLTAQLRSYCDHWEDIVTLDDAALAALVQKHEIDILVDFHLHTNHNRLLAFARKPAPVQVTFAGYPGTTGLTAIDYRLTDPYLDPPGTHDEFYAERSIRLPHSFWCLDPLDLRPAPAPRTRSPNQALIWGSLNNPTKINSTLLGWWAKILHATQPSRLLALAYNESDRQRVRAALVAHGVEGDRVEFVPGQSRLDYLNTYSRCDIILDTYPYNGHTTGCDALWMGVPIVSLAGETAVSRAGLSLLSNVGLPELVATTPDDYVRIAVELARAPARLAELHATLRQRTEASPLMDGSGWTRGIEAAFREMWCDWCARAAS